MGWRAGANEDNGSAEVAHEVEDVVETPEAAEGPDGGAEPTLGDAEDKGSKRGVYLILGGLVLTGIAAGWNWLRGLPKNQEDTDE